MIKNILFLSMVIFLNSYTFARNVKIEELNGLRSDERDFYLNNTFDIYKNATSYFEEYRTNKTERWCGREARRYLQYVNSNHASFYNRVEYFTGPFSDNMDEKAEISREYVNDIIFYFSDENKRKTLEYTYLSEESYYNAAKKENRVDREEHLRFTAKEKKMAKGLFCNVFYNWRKNYISLLTNSSAFYSCYEGFQKVLRIRIEAMQRISRHICTEDK